MSSRATHDSSTHENLARPAQLDVVIVTYNNRGTISRCLDSIRTNLVPQASTVVHVVDNNSPDLTADLVAAEFPWVRLHRRLDNAGFAVANNTALRQVEAPWVLVLNPDTEILPDSVVPLIAEAEENARVGVVGCRLLRLDGSFDHAAKRSFPAPVEALRYFASGKKGGSRYLAPHVAEDGTGPVDAVNGAFMLVRTAAMRDVGLLDEEFWMYGEDLDWCRRFADKGWSVLYDGRYTAIHLKGASSGERRPLRLNWHFHKSMAIFYKKHDAGRSVPLDLLVYAGIFAKFTVSALANTLHGARSAA